MLFDEFFVMLGQQLVQLMIETGAPDLDAALRELNVGDLGGFVSRFLMGGLRLPDPSDPGALRALYVLTGQQFPLRQDQGDWVLTAELQAQNPRPTGSRWLGAPARRWNQGWCTPRARPASPGAQVKCLPLPLDRGFSL